MIDLETLSTRSNAVIMSIGVVQFDLRGNTLDRLHYRVDIHDCIKHGLHVHGGTVQWWLEQPKKNIDNLLKIESVYGLEQALHKLEYEFLPMLKECTYVWSHGSNFDVVVLENAYQAIGREVWWKYKNVRDTRTLFDLADYKYVAKGGHDALEDARNQAQAVQEAYQLLMGGKNGTN
jgi:hypothetical protein